MVVWTHNLSKAVMLRRRETVLYQVNPSATTVIQETKGNYTIWSLGPKYYPIGDLYEAGVFEIRY